MEHIVKCKCGYAYPPYNSKEQAQRVAASENAFSIEQAKLNGENVEALKAKHSFEVVSS